LTKPGKRFGTCGFHNVKPEHRRAEIGYELGREFWSQGIMQEVLKVVIDYCFGRLNFNRLEAFVTQGNSRSLNTLLSLGFQVEGALRNYEYVRGEFQDQIILALLKREWESKSDSGVRQSLG
jgi:ribosomal-protein-alanine N-acetyltransferase